jgi:hypothetical protein
VVWSIILLGCCGAITAEVDAETTQHSASLGVAVAVLSLLTSALYGAAFFVKAEKAEKLQR